MADPQFPRTAPFYNVPQRPFTSVEHPAIVKDVDKAIDTLQGATGVSKILNPPKDDSPANLVLRPEDAMARPVQSISSPANNILLKVTVPKRTGRKRKKGSNEPFTGPAEEEVEANTTTTEPQRRSARDLQRSLRDNVDKYQVEPVGMVNRTHVFRGMPDFVFSTTASPFTNRFREQILSFDYDKMKNFDLDMSKGAVSNVDIIPPPSFSYGDIPFSYIYHQNPNVRHEIDKAGGITTVNTQQAVKVLTHLVPYEATDVPTQPRENCPPISTLEPTLQETIAIVSDLFTQRPAWTRRALRNKLSTVEQRYALRHAIPYIGYIFRSGPWRDAIIRFGHDPRTSPDYRTYQTVMFRILPREPELARDGGSGRRHTLPRENEVTYETSATGGGDSGPLLTSNTHIFTGQAPLHRDGRIWMLCDITDPILVDLLHLDRANPPAAGFLRERCEISSDGWYRAGTLAKAKTIMRAKIAAFAEDKEIQDAEFARVLEFPDEARPESFMRDFVLDAGSGGVTPRDGMLAAEVRKSIKGTLAWRNLVAARAGGGETRGGGGAESGGARRVRFQGDGGEEGEEDGDGDGDGDGGEESEGDEAMEGGDDEAEP